MAEPDNTPTAPETNAPLRRGGPRRRAHSPTLSVAVTKDHIATAVPRDSGHCMISDAVTEVLPEAWRAHANVQTDLSTIRFTNPEKRVRYIYLTPRVGQIALIEFDRGILPEPFRFRLKTAAQIVRNSGGRPKGSKNGTRKDRTSTQYLQHQYEADRDRRILRGQIHATDADQVFEPPVEQRERVVRALEDPDARLGPAMAVEPADGNKASVPVIVGGRAPPPGNLAKVRRFGLRQLRE